ncbi:MAG TPA: CU044_5270 family protein, partial [Micromonospora sp.]
VLRLAATAALAQPFTEPRADQFLYLETVYDGHTRQDWLSMDGTHDGLVATMGADPGVPVPGCRDGRRAVVRGTTVGPGTEPCEPDPAYLPDLPTDATAMGLHLRAMGGHPGTNSWAKNAAELGLHHYLRPAARAALYQAAAEIDGVTVVPGVTDGAGRPGTGIRWTHGGTGPGVTMVFDPTTHLFLGFQDGDALVKAVVVDAVGDTA